jgi:plasmid stabilization system protein ParE
VTSANGTASKGPHESLRVSGRAEQDADSIFDWIAARSPDGALRWYMYLSTLRGLAADADGCEQAPEAERLGIDLQQKLFKTRKGRRYRGLFVTDQNTVHIVAVRGPGQDLATADDIELPE